MKYVDHLLICVVSTGFLACEVVIGFEYVVEVSPEIPQLKVFDLDHRKQNKTLAIITLE